MPIRTILLLPVLAFTLAGCLENNTQRGVAGAVGGALVADALGGNAVAGAVVGGAAGALCNGANVKACRNQ
jgi:hypothetical protein